MKIHTEQRWLSTADMCARYGVSRMTINRWEKDGRIPKASRSGRQPRWWGPMVDEYDNRSLAKVESTK